VGSEEKHTKTYQKIQKNTKNPETVSATGGIPLKTLIERTGRKP